MQRDAGLSGYRLMILGSNFGGAGSDWDRKAIGIGIRMTNTMTFAEVLAVAGHELGHMYRHEHPDSPFVGPITPGLSAKREAEIEADRLGACLTGDVAATIGSLRHGGVTLDPSLPADLRIAAVQSMPSIKCPIGKGWSRGGN